MFFGDLSPSSFCGLFGEKEGFDNLRVDGNLHNCEASLFAGSPKECILVVRVPPVEVLKFSVDGAIRGKLGSPASEERFVIVMGWFLVHFSKHVACM